MVFPKVMDTSLTGRMADIEKAFDAGAYLSAISLALTIPDVCSSRLHPDVSTRRRYVNWFNAYVAQNYLDEKSLETDGVMVASKYYFDGDDCYQLRCVYLHEGTNAPDLNKGKTLYNAIQFRVFEDGPSDCDHIGKSWSDTSGLVFRQVDLDLRKFIRCLKAGVESYVERHQGVDADNGSESLFYQPVLDFMNGHELL